VTRKRKEPLFCDGMTDDQKATWQGTNREVTWVLTSVCCMSNIPLWRLRQLSSILLSSAHKIYLFCPTRPFRQLLCYSCHFIVNYVSVVAFELCAIVLSLRTTFRSSYLSRSPENEGYFVLVMIIPSALEIMSLCWTIQVSHLSIWHFLAEGWTPN